MMYCPKCGKRMEEETSICISCEQINIVCPKCKEIVSIDDAFCGSCGQDLTEEIEKAKQLKNVQERVKKAKKEVGLAELKRRKEEQEMNDYAEDLIIDCEGNKFKAIKQFKDKYKVDNTLATEYVTRAYDKVNNSVSENDNDSQQLVSIEEIVRRNNYDKVSSISEVKKIYGIGLAEAKEAVDNAVSANRSSNAYVNPNGIKKTIIVSQSSRKKASSAIGRGIVGGALLGPVGLLAGASAKSKDTTTFQVIYNSGKQDTVTVKNNSWQFKEYCKYLDN